MPSTCSGDGFTVIMSFCLVLGSAFNVPSRLDGMMGSSQIEYEEKAWAHKRARDL